MAEPESSARESAFRVGEVLREKYRLVDVLGVGGMATVYEAHHRNGHRFAVKILHPEFSAHTEIRTRFVREGYVANRVEHPGVVDIVDDDVAEDGSPFVVMELLDGESAASLVGPGRSVPARRVLEIADEVLDVLEAAHARGVVHRDLKPANLFVTAEGRIKVLDFGIARLREADVGKTATGLAIGTPAFMAPEQAAGRVEDIDPRTDLWALGATMFALIAGESVHSGTNPQHQVVNAATQPARSLAAATPGVHPAIVEVVDRALAFEPSARFANALEMRGALRAAGAQAFGTFAPAARGAAPGRSAPGGRVAVGDDLERTLPPLRARTPRRIRIGVVLVSVVVGLAVGLLWLRFTGRLPPTAELAPAVTDALSLAVPGRGPETAPDTKGVPIPEAASIPAPIPEPASIRAPDPAPIAVPLPEPDAAPVPPAAGVGPRAEPDPVTPRPPAPGATVRAAPEARAPSVRPSRTCSRLLERQSLGEMLSPEERETLRRECRG